MSDTINIYGHEIELAGQESHITDVVILAREIIYNDDGTMADALLTRATPNTTWITQLGIIEAARQVMSENQE